MNRTEAEGGGDVVGVADAVYDGGGRAAEEEAREPACGYDEPEGRRGPEVELERGMEGEGREIGEAASPGEPGGKERQEGNEGDQEEGGEGEELDTPAGHAGGVDAVDQADPKGGVTECGNGQDEAGRKAAHHEVGSGLGAVITLSTTVSSWSKRNGLQRTASFWRPAWRHLTMEWAGS